MRFGPFLALLSASATRDLAEVPLSHDEMAVLLRLSRRARRRRLGWSTPCLLFRGDNNGKGYRRVRVCKKRVAVHRWLFETFHGDATGFDVDHECGARACGIHVRRLAPWKNRGWKEPAGES